MPAMEVAEPVDAVGYSFASKELHALPLTMTFQRESDVIALLPPGTLMKAVSTCLLPDGTRRMCVALNDHTIGSFGCVTTRREDGAPLIHRYARPVYEVTKAPLKVRKSFDLSSKFVKQLGVGTRLHLVNIKHAADGVARACVVVLNSPHISNERPFGWITVRKSRGAGPMITEVDEPRKNRSAPSSSTTALGLRVCTPPYERPRQTMSSPQLPSNPLSLPVPSPPPPPSAHLGFYQSTVAAHTRAVPSPTTSGSPGSPAGALSSPHSPQPVVGQSALQLIMADPQGGATVAEGQRQGHWKSAFAKLKSTNKSVAAVVDHSAAAAVSAKTPMATTAELRAAAAQLVQAASAKEDHLRSKGVRTLAVEIAKALHHQGFNTKDARSEEFLDSLMKQWDPNRDGTISKMEFRQCVRKLVPGADIKECDALFEKLDKDQSNDVDHSEMKLALRKLATAMTNMDKMVQRVHDETMHMRKKALRIEEVAKVTLVYEEAVATLKAARNRSVGAQLGAILKYKGLKLHEIVEEVRVHAPPQSPMPPCPLPAARCPPRSRGRHQP